MALTGAIEQPWKGTSCRLLSPSDAVFWGRVRLLSCAPLRRLSLSSA